MTMGVGGTAEADLRGFAAFISYSHSDAAVATKLQRQLERYRFPKNVEVSQSGQSQALGKIFRDRDDLAAAPNLSDAIRDALSQSQALIVVCSPDAKKSRWVNEEIGLFRSLHPDRPILSALVRGEPWDALPDALSADGIEPLAADMRKGADGWSHGFLKIVAGIAGVSLDTLVQRDAQRRVRRVTYITLGAVAAMLVMGVMTIYAISARNEAARQRASAEGLVEFMITDLGDRLDSVGRLDVMRSVNARAIGYYDRQGNKLPQDSENRRARVLHAIGDIEDRQGNLDAAIGHFRNAHRITEKLYLQNPGNSEHIFAHAQSEYWLGRAALQRKQNAEARQHWQEYLALAEKLAEREPGSVRSLMEQGYAEGNLCEIEFVDANGKADAAPPHCRKALNFVARAASKAPRNSEVLMTLANRQGWMSDMLEAKGDLSGAISLRLAETKTVDALLRSDPANVEFARRRNLPTVSLAYLYLDQGRLDEAQAVIEPGVARLEAAMKRAPDNPLVSIERLRLAYYEVELARKRGGDWRQVVAEALRLSKQLEKDFGPELRTKSTAFDAIERIALSRR